MLTLYELRLVLWLYFFEHWKACRNREGLHTVLVYTGISVHSPSSKGIYGVSPFFYTKTSTAFASYVHLTLNCTITIFFCLIWSKMKTQYINLQNTEATFYLKIYLTRAKMSIKVLGSHFFPSMAVYVVAYCSIRSGTVLFCLLQPPQKQQHTG